MKSRERGTDTCRAGRARREEGPVRCSSGWLRRQFCWDPDTWLSPARFIGKWIFLFPQRKGFSLSYFMNHWILTVYLLAKTYYFPCWPHLTCRLVPGISAGDCDKSEHCCLHLQGIVTISLG